MRSVHQVAVLLALLALPRAAGAEDAALFYLFLLNGETVTSYGEFTRVDDRVIFSMPVGGSAEDPRLHVVTLPAGLIDWTRTNRHVASSRYQRYVSTRGEEDFRLLTAQVARVLGEIALTTDRRRALEIAESARRTLADWPRAHYGYRQDEVRDVLGVLDGAISTLRGSAGGAAGAASFELSLVATLEPIAVEPPARMPSAREQLDQMLRVAEMTSLATERIALLQTALALLHEAGARQAAALSPAALSPAALSPAALSTALPGVDVTAMRRVVEARIRDEQHIDARYSRMAKQLAQTARGFAARGRVAAAERLLTEIQKQDERLGRQRPELVVALQASVQAHVESARRLRLLRDRWLLRQSVYRDYRRSVGFELSQLTGARPHLEAIRALAGPDPRRLKTLRTRLSGGAERLSRLRIPDDLRPAHELLIAAWRFAENAAGARYAAIESGNLSVAREASSAAAGALMMLSRAQDEIRDLLEPPRLP
jgi:hypothetical protein